MVVTTLTASVDNATEDNGDCVPFLKNNKGGIRYSKVSPKSCVLIIYLVLKADFIVKIISVQHKIQTFHECHTNV